MQHLEKLRMLNHHQLMQLMSSSPCSLGPAAVGKRIGDPAAGGRRKQHAAGKMHGRAAWFETGREDGGEEMQLSSCTHS